MKNLSELTGLDDIALVREIQHGNEEAMTEFYHRFAPGLHSFIRGKIQELADIEDILSETMAAAVTAIIRFKGESRVFTWLCRIAQYKVADYYRNRKNSNPLPLDEIASISEPESKDLELNLVIWKVLLGLQYEYRRVLEDKYFYGFSTREIAVKMGRSEKAVDSMLVRARQAFAREYKQLMPEAEVLAFE